MLYEDKYNKNTYQIITNILINETMVYAVMLLYTGIEILQVCIFFHFPSFSLFNLQFFSDHFFLLNLSTILMCFLA